MNKFYDIYLDLKAEIENGKYTKGDLLPSENKLSNLYNVSRETVRKSLVHLIEIGYIQKKQGKGSVVLDTAKHKLTEIGLISYKELQDMRNVKSITKILKNEEIVAPDFLVELGLLNKGDKVIHLLRQRIVDNEVVVLDRDYVKASLTGKLPNKKIKHSLYKYLEDELKIKIAYAKKNISIDLVTKEDDKLMDLNGDKHVVVVKSDIYTEDTSFLHYTESRQRLDKFEITEFSRRENHGSSN